ncbi:hypothetical protein PIB30_038945 [Stylosanthes scabra]|uniref:Uncharacterized protein n=1 Tax=Stylosanthes scabra TaxID=79078 RepID=A0ABU6UFW4_9FABA|nr:hypothetical protein [Stylosanthes scabra]
MKHLEGKRATRIAAGEPTGPPINEDEGDPATGEGVQAGDGNLEVAATSSFMPPLPPPSPFSARPPRSSPIITASAPTPTDTHFDNGSSFDDKEDDYD